MRPSNHSVCYDAYFVVCSQSETDFGGFNLFSSLECFQGISTQKFSKYYEGCYFDADFNHEITLALHQTAFVSPVLPPVSGLGAAAC